MGQELQLMKADILEAQFSSLAPEKRVLIGMDHKDLILRYFWVTYYSYHFYIICVLVVKWGWQNVTKFSTLLL